MSNLLEEALMDIEQIKKAVEEEAKNKLVESLSPKIRKFINDKLYENALSDKEGDTEVDDDEKDVRKKDNKNLEILHDQVNESEEEAITYEKDPQTGDEVAILDLDELKTNSEKEQVIDLDDEDVEVEVDLEEFRNMIAKFKGDKKMKLKDLFLKEEIEQCEEGCDQDSSLGEEEILEIDENELKEAIKNMKAKRNLKERKLRESEIVLDIDVDEEGEIEDVEVVSVGDEDAITDEDEMEFDLDMGEEGEDLEGEESEFELDGEEGGEMGEEDLEGEEPVMDMDEEELEEEKPSMGEAKLRKMIRKMIREVYKKKLRESEVTVDTDDGLTVRVNADGEGVPDVEIEPEDDMDMDLETEPVMPEPMGMEESKKIKRSVLQLKKKLVETNLMNAKLVYANKLLMNSEITKKERIAIIESLDKAKSLREVELVYKTLTNKSKKNDRVNEGRRVLAGGSSATLTGKSVNKLNEAVDQEMVDFFTKMAGIK